MTPSRLLIASLIALGAAGCASHQHDTADRMHEMMHGNMAVATLTPTQGNTVRGIVMFHEHDGEVMVHAKLTGVPPGEHGFHVHDIGNCASADGTSAGGHYNPAKTAHGPQDGEHHAGDMPSLIANSDGVVDQMIMLHGVSVGDGPNSLIGRSVIVHANPDDYKTQPAGNAGPRIACGVIAAH